MKSLLLKVSRRQVLFFVFAVVTILVAVAHPWTYFGYHSVCVRTGMIRYSCQYGVFTRHRIEETSLSRVLTGSGFREPNDHQWVFAHGRGAFPRESASGPALSMPGLVKSPEVAAIVQRLIRFTDKATAEKWIGRLLDPQVCWHTQFRLAFVREATNGTDFVEGLKRSEEEFAIDEFEPRSRR